jgi:Tol biopolymer transport system component
MLAAGTKLGPYEIVSSLGAGGMGEVYRARDTRLDRTVAIKVLPSTLADDPQLRDRFEREARAISALSHPHICTLFDVGHQDGVDFLVLEYLEGETVAERLARAGRLDPSEALKIAIDIGDALDRAHRSGIVHRDLKPANVMLTDAGAKLLDFGLAKTAAPAVATTALSMLPTTPPNLTAQGTILGTFQYMAPEQIEGLEADARTDIFAFGALLFEMLTGRPAFEGKTRASLLGAILKDEPPAVSRVQPLAPSALDRTISTCLAKDPDDRYQSARDLLRDLKWVASGSSPGVAAPTVARPARSSRVAWLVAALSTIALIATAIIALQREVAPAAGPVRFTIAPPEKMSFGGPSAGGTGDAAQLAVSPDGQNIVFVAGAQSSYQIWLRPIGARAAEPIPGTEGGAFPFWSPDSRSIGFFAGGKLKKVQIGGGPAIPLCDAPSGRGGSWSRANVILFSPTAAAGTGLMRVSSAGGAPTVVTTVDPATKETNHRWPHFLPDGRHFIYTSSVGGCCPPETPSTIRIGSLDDDSAVSLFHVESSVSYASGHLFFARDETLMAQPFDPDTHLLTGEAFPMAERVGPEGSRYVSASVSQNGTLVYAQGSQARQHLTWFDRTGGVLATLGEAPFPRQGSAAGRRVALSPDEKQVAVAMATGSPENQDIWIIDLARNGLRSRFTEDQGRDRSPIWSPDATVIAFAAERSGQSSLRQRVVNRAAADELLLESGGAGDAFPTDWSADGRFIAYTLTGSFPARSDIWVLPLFGDRKPFPVAQTAFREGSAVFSRDARSIAYMSDQAGRPNVYVQRFPDGGARVQVSRDGGTQPVWAPSGKELFFLGPDGMMMAAPIDATDRIEAGIPQPLFRAVLTSSLVSEAIQYAITKDGKRFLVHSRPLESSATPLTVVINWPATIQK